MVYFQCFKHVFLFLPVFSMFFMNTYTGYVCINGHTAGGKNTDLPTIFFSSLLRQYNKKKFGPNYGFMRWPYDNIVKLRTRRPLHYSTILHSEPEGLYCLGLCTVIAPFWFSMEHLWMVITPFWISTDDMIFLMLIFLKIIAHH